MAARLAHKRAIVATDDDVRDLQDFNRELQHVQAVQVGVLGKRVNTATRRVIRSMMKATSTACHIVALEEALPHGLFGWLGLRWFRPRATAL